MDYISLGEDGEVITVGEYDIYFAFNGTRPGSPHIIAGPLTVYFEAGIYTPLSPTDGFKMRYKIIPNIVGKYMPIVFIIYVILYYIISWFFLLSISVFFNFIYFHIVREYFITLFYYHVPVYLYNNFTIQITLFFP